MLIDWFTVIAQALNFLILVWLLKRFLYKPVLDAIDARERLVAAQLQDAAQKEASARREREEYQRRNDDIARQRESLLGEAADAAKVERQRLIEQARHEADTLRQKLQADAQGEHEALSREITGRAQKEVFAIARKTLADLSDTSLEERMVAAFIQRLRDLPADAKQSITAFLKTARHPALVRSAFDLPPQQRSAVELAVREAFDAVSEVRFETNAALVGGIELTTDGHKIAWSIADYLTSLERSVDDLLQNGHDDK